MDPRVKEAWALDSFIEKHQKEKGEGHSLPEWELQKVKSSWESAMAGQRLANVAAPLELPEKLAPISQPPRSPDEPPLVICYDRDSDRLTPGNNDYTQHMIRFVRKHVPSLKGKAFELRSVGRAGCAMNGPTLKVDELDHALWSDERGSTRDASVVLVWGKDGWVVDAPSMAILVNQSKALFYFIFGDALHKAKFARFKAKDLRAQLRDPKKRRPGCPVFAHLAEGVASRFHEAMSETTKHHMRHLWAREKGAPKQGEIVFTPCEGHEEKTVVEEDDGKERLAPEQLSPVVDKHSRYERCLLQVVPGCDM